MFGNLPSPMAGTGSFFGDPQNKPMLSSQDALAGAGNSLQMLLQTGPNPQAQQDALHYVTQLLMHEGADSMEATELARTLVEEASRGNGPIVMQALEQFSLADEARGREQLRGVGVAAGAVGGAAALAKGGPEMVRAGFNKAGEYGQNLVTGAKEFAARAGELGGAGFEQAKSAAAKTKRAAGNFKAGYNYATESTPHYGPLEKKVANNKARAAGFKAGRAKEGLKEASKRAPGQIREATAKGVEKTKQVASAAKEKGGKMAAAAKEKGGKMAAAAKERGGKMAASAKETAGRMKETASTAYAESKARREAAMADQGGGKKKKKNKNKPKKNKAQRTQELMNAKSGKKAAPYADRVSKSSYEKAKRILAKPDNYSAAKVRWADKVMELFTSKGSKAAKAGGKIAKVASKLL